MTDTRFTQTEEFEAKQQAWYKSVASVFARIQKKDVADVPLDVWRKLVRTTYDGIEVNPLYNRVDEVREAAAPGEFPFTRAAAGAGAQEGVGWGVTESFGANATNAELLAALENGTTDLVIYGEPILAELLKGVLFQYAPVRLNAGVATAKQAQALYELVDAQEGTPVRLELGASPLTSLVDGSPSVDLDAAVELAKEAANRENTRAILVDAVSLSNQGATDGEEIGLAIAAGVDYLRALTDAGLSVEQALGQLSFRYAVSDDQFAQISKLRAARTLWARVAEVLGAAEHGCAPQHALTAPVMFSQRDPWVNMLRSTVAAFAGGVGGATDVEVLTFDWAIPGGLPNTSRTFAHRIARNTNLLLLEESHLGHVIDPAGGSYYVEQLTNQLAEKAWAVFQDIESKGGFAQAVEAGAVKELLDASHEKVRNDIAHRTKKLTAINEFPNLAEAALPADLRVEPTHVRRWAAQFEAMRNRSDAFQEVKGNRPRIALIPLGPLAKHNIRTGFATNLLASGGIEALNPGQVVPGTPEFDEAAKAAPIAVICGTDAEYVANGKEAFEALRAAGVEHILVAGAPNDEFTADGYLNLKIDAAAELEALLEKLGA
ncbi:methylmalonyl-CoA mutase family protein [Corynebacterium sp. 153RC1]|uniref:methylmalonyl-CoA mutase family protein n=1 Tax=unclassified Corynebacterium TaxID=2624378 RepID=UPI00211C493A|nr:methylmalonyl-CoA mutase family protein [Corynebacterium sp. 209RC1]MCQ9354412.1 methylmalonyl-CoA mutase family protein [Corynebacterium sp. 1222RC1]MCQ9356699.1 methylmalonyl-CoA mutase family protein [Corynebacterium sp. 122RC1]MCQ9358807.1 methylmalonyl-CoA mutase family protein [Corynebacterium sp. 142RC1]MCQ9361205.1 methylmalonyl-CoA mutase family protein [Corynebacterium sp. 153RC1]MCQ9363362.1 methylmalonyl-CoA mutase family protein [Corynebacterium sp. 732RC1]MCQ9365012.1 methylm